jgi:hypothetical protein
MAITPEHVEVVARRVADQLLVRDVQSRDQDDRMLRQKAAPLAYDACRALMSALAGRVAEDEALVDVRNGVGYSVAGLGGVKVDVKLLVGTDRRMWFCRHQDGAVQQLDPIDLGAMTIEKKRISMGFPKLEGTTVTCGGATAEWLEELRSGRTQPADWLQPGQTQAQTQPAARWSEHVSDGGVTAVDPVGA